MAGKGLRSTLQCSAHRLEGVKFAFLGSLRRHMLTQDDFDALREGLARVAAIAQQALHPAQAAFFLARALQQRADEFALLAAIASNVFCASPSIRCCF